tara:strand:- start:88 stop:423 length:336 start_codon:yes stop_codon:yes gene_type:complete
MKIYKSNNGSYLYVARLNHINKVYFGDGMALNVIMASDKRRSIYSDKISLQELKEEYFNCCNVENLNKYHSVESLEYYLLYNKGNLKDSIKDYVMRFGVYITYYNEVYANQ